MRVALTLVLLASLAGVSAASAVPQQRIVFAADRTTTRTGEIYSFNLATGVTRNISRSLAYDSGPAVSPDGKWIAFGSTRTGTLGLYIARIDGSQLRLVKRFHPGLNGLVAEWSPDGTRVAATSCCTTATAELWIGTPAGSGTTLWDAAAYGGTAWSRDGRFFAYAAHDLASDQITSLDVVDAYGRRVSRHDADQLRDVGWFDDGQLTWMDGAQAHVATATGRAGADFPAQNIAMSPDGRALAVVRTHSIELRRSGGVRTVYRSKHLLGVNINWLGSHHLVFALQNDDSFSRLDLRTGKVAVAGYQEVSGTVSPDGRLLAAVYWPNSSYRHRALRVGPLLGSTGRVIASTRDCPDDHSNAYDRAQFVPHTRLIVYVAECGDPTADLYAVGADGKGLRQLTFTAQHEQTPVLSPDGSRIAYIRWAATGHACEGCPSELWVMNADGSHARRLTAPGVKNATGNWDSNPSWSPDGKSIMFDRSTINGGWRLMTISAGGGTPTVLPIPGARHGVWGPKRILYSGDLGAIWTALPDGSDRVEIAPRHTCDSGCFYTWTPKGPVYATVKRHVTHSTIVIKGAGPQRKIQLPFQPAKLEWLGTSLLVAPPANGFTGQWSEGDLYRVTFDGTLTRLTTGLGSISLD